MAQSKLDILIAAKSTASPVLKNTASELGNIDKFAGNAAKGLGGLAVAGGVAGLASLATGAVMAGLELSRLGAQAERLETAFGGLTASAGQSGDAMLQAMRDASRGAIADTDLMLGANKAMLLGVADSAEEMTALLEIASARGRAMGLSTTQAFNDIVVGLGRGSALILDNLGITVDLERTYKDYAATLGVTASALTAAQQKQALLNEVIRSSAGIVAANAAAGDDAASKFERMDATLANSKVALGEFFSPAFTAGALLFTGYLQSQIEMLKNETNALEEAWVALKNFATGGNEVSSSTLRMAEAAGKADDITRRLTFGLTGLGAAARTGGDGLTAMELKAANLATRLAGLKAQSDATRASLAGIESAAISSLQSAASGAVGVMGASAVAQQYGPAAEKLKAQIKVLGDLRYGTDELRFKSEELAARAGLPFTTATEAAREAEREAKKYASALGGEVTDAAKDAEQAFEGLRSKVAGVLSQALDPGVGVDPDKLLENMGIPRADAINENARRLADIAANGLKGQDWLGAFRAEVPDIWNMIRTAGNPQEEAAHLLRDFQDGLLTSAIDKGKAKELVRRMLMGEASMAELAQEIAQELSAEMGVPLAQAMSAATGALGGGGTALAGNDAGRNFSEGAVAAMQESGGGGAMVDEFVAQAKANYAKLRTAGNEAGRNWGSAFMETVGANVPPALIDILVNLTTPGIMAKIAQQGTLTGAVP